MDPILLELYLHLYEQAVDTEAQSQSRRVAGMRPNHCKIGLGVSIPNQTEFLFFGLCHGGDAEVANQPINQQFIEGYHGDGTMNWYLQNGLMDHSPYQTAMNGFLMEMYDQGVNGTTFDWISRWGSCDVSFFTGAIQGRDHESIIVETRESSLVIQQQLTANVRALVFSGIWNRSYLHGLFPTMGDGNIERNYIEGEPIGVEHVERELWNNRIIQCYHVVHFSSIRMRQPHNRNAVATALHGLMHKDGLV